MTLFRPVAVFAVVFAVAAASFAQAPMGDKKSAKPAGKPQSAVAAKTAWLTTKTTDPAVAKALKASDLAGAKKMVGKPGAFTGTVAAIFAPKSGKIVILNFDKDYKKALTAVVPSAHFAKFPNLETLKGKRVLVSGKFVSFKDVPQIELTAASQVKVLK